MKEKALRIVEQALSDKDKEIEEYESDAIITQKRFERCQVYKSKLNAIKEVIDKGTKYGTNQEEHDKLDKIKQILEAQNEK